MIRVANLRKKYGDRWAMNSISFLAHDGQATFLLGPNGAGKSTLLKTIAGLITPATGDVRIDGQPLRALPQPLRSIGFGIDPGAFDPAQSAERHLRWQARLGGVSTDAVRPALQRVGLGRVGHKRVGDFSLGMVQRLAIAAALLGNPSTVVLDEPANGLDVEGTLWLRALVRELAEDGVCLLIASHDLAEVEIAADRIVVLGRGRVLADAPTASVLELGHPPRRLESAYLHITGQAGLDAPEPKPEPEPTTVSHTPGSW